MLSDNKNTDKDKNKSKTKNLDNKVKSEMYYEKI